MERVYGRLSIGLAGLFIATVWPREVRAQAPTIEQTGQIQSGIGGVTPGSTQSLLGPMPGGGAPLPGIQPGRDELLLSRAGPSVPRVPTAITMPGGTYQGPPPRRGILAPQPLPAPRPPLYGRLELPRGPQDDGPANGLTIGQALDLYVHQNLDLRALALEIPQSQADVLTASLRANPILYADSQLIPYGVFSRARPAGPTQYDLNISHPIDYSHKRQARTSYAEVNLRVTENQYQDAVRVGLGNVYSAYVDVLLARQTLRASRVAVEGLDQVVRAMEAMYRSSTTTLAEVDQIRADREVAAIGLVDAEANLKKANRVLGELLNVPPDQAETLEVRGTLEDLAPPPPSDHELIRMALDCRPDIAAYRLGVQAAQAGLKLQLANRFADAYLLYQPFTYQNNVPYGDRGSVPSWAVGITVPLPVYNRNQGNIERARINIDQSRVQLAALERRVITEVQQAVNEYRVSGTLVRQIRTQVDPVLKRHVLARERLFREGEKTVFEFRDAEKRYNDHVRTFYDAAARHRKAMLQLNTVVGLRIFP
jgi:cobalt-zinc-cadmium efflux system outer membrane protein